MASSTKIVFRFGTTSGEKNFTYNYGNDEVSGATVKATMNTMIANGSIFRYPPLTIISAKTVITTESDIDVS